MGLIREPIDVDFYVKSKPLSKDEKKNLSDFIQERKQILKTNGQSRYKRVLKKRKK